MGTISFRACGQETGTMFLAPQGPRIFAYIEFYLYFTSKKNTKKLSVISHKS